MHLGSPEKYQMYVKSNLGQQVPALTLALALTLTLSPNPVPGGPTGCLLLGGTPLGEVSCDIAPQLQP